MLDDRQFVAWDIEVAALVPEDEAWEDHRPYGITCAALAWEGGTQVFEAAGGRMTADETCYMLHELIRWVDHGWTVFTWNGLGFDFDVLAEELTCGCSAKCAKLAASDSHVDGMLHVHALKGFPTSLAKTAEGLGLEGKFEGMKGSDAPRLWAEGERATVLEYVERDAKLQLEVALEVERLGEYAWVTRAGKRQTIPIRRWATVPEARVLPLPDTSWMDAAFPREKFSGWLAEYGL